jgi:glycosyltransferase involved in cell wall biosynthesis
MERHTDPKRVAWLIKGLGPGGAERLLVATAAAMDRSRFSIETYYLLPQKHHLTTELNDLGIPTTCLNVGNERDLRWVRDLRRILAEKHFDVLHVHSPYVASFTRLAARTLRPRPRIVTTEHNPWPTFKPATRFMNALTSPLSDATIAVSEEVRASMWPWMQRRSETLTHGIDLEAARAQIGARLEMRRELGINDDLFLVGTVANYHPKKDWPNLLRAARLAYDRDNRVRFCAVGQGPLETQVRALHAELDLQGIVVLTGYRPDAVRLMAACDAFMLASQWEGMPVALMEATALTLPIVATAVGGIPEAFRSGTDALLVRSGDSVALADAVVALANDTVLYDSMRRASACMASRFDVRQAVQRIEGIYDEVSP